MPIPAPPPYNIPSSNASIKNLNAQVMQITVGSNDPNPPLSHMPNGTDVGKLMIDYIKVYKHKPILTGPVLCPGETGTFTVSNFDFDDHIVVSVSSNQPGPPPTITLISGQTYSITAAPNGQTSVTITFTDPEYDVSELIQVITSPNPTLTISGSGLTCVPSDYCVAAPLNSSCSWNVPTGVQYTGSGNCIHVSNWNGQPSGNITVTVTYSNGCIARGQIQVNDCCDEPGYTTYNNWTLLTSPSPGSKLIFNGTTTIAANTPVVFDQVDVLMGQNAAILIENGASLTITSSTNIPSYIRACNQMWNGIRVVQNSTGQLRIDKGTLIEDGIEAVFIMYPGILQLHNSFLNKNFIGVHLMDGNFSTSNVTNTNFSCNGILASNSKGPGGSTAANSDVHIMVENTINVTIGDLSSHNSFRSTANTGILSISSNNVSIINNLINNMTTNGISAYGWGSIHISDGNELNNNKIGVNIGTHTLSSIVDNSFTDNDQGIACIKTMADIDIIRNTIIDSHTYGINSSSNSNRHQFIKYNRLSGNYSSPSSVLATGINIYNSHNQYYNSCEVSFNEIENHKYGIDFKSCDYTWTEGNTISLPFNDNASNEFIGIRSEASNSLTFNENYVDGQFMNDLILNGYGILHKNSLSNSTWCNTITGVWRGVQFEDMTSQLDLMGFAGNNLSYCDVELYLLNVPNGLGQQGDFVQPSDNIWDMNCNYNTMSDASNTTSTTEFFVRPNGTYNYVGNVNNGVSGGGNACLFNINNTSVDNFCNIAEEGGARRIITERSDIDEITISPNPGSGLINIKQNGYIYKTLKIYDFVGKLVFEKRISGEIEEIDLSALKNGIYSVHFISNDSKQNIMKISIIK